jgi:hypothetical protein
MKKIIGCICATAFVATKLSAYGPVGHELVGAVADELLKKKPAGAQISALIDGITLEKAAVMPDEIKAWDRNGPDDPKAFPHYADHTKIDNQLREFWHANPPTKDAKSPTPSHHWFHYTDVPVFNAVKYSEGKVGRNQWDIVHMIPYCVSVLRGETPEDNPRKITKPVAVLLLAHYVGDIHQPLHVGAEYFAQSGQPTDPDRDANAMEDQGGNSLSLIENASAAHPRHYYRSFHAFWDVDAVRQLIIGTTDEPPKEKRDQAYAAPRAKLLGEFVANEPKNWRTNGDPKTWAEQWANEILPTAREAHTRLNFVKVRREEKDGAIFARGEADEIATGYREWASGIVREELWKAGWRLADLLQKTVGEAASLPGKQTASPAETTRSTSTPVSVVPPPANEYATPASPFGNYPANYKEIVTAYVQTQRLSASNIDWQSEPKPADLPDASGRHHYGYLVIFNTGPKTRSVLIHDGAVVSAAGFDR